MGFDLERDFEDALIAKLRDEKGWVDGVIENPTPADLLDNWARIVFENNNTRDKLNGCPLTEFEKSQLLEHLTRCRSPYEANELLRGEAVDIKRDNADDALHCGSVVSLRIFDKLSVGGGKNRYQIARQPEFPVNIETEADRRGDVSLLINGLPVIHIELKRTGVSPTVACNQIKSYLHRGIFDGIFGMVQMFVAMNPEQAVYFANPGRDYVDAHGDLPVRYMFHYADERNAVLDEWDRVASRLLSIPAAHKMVSLYTIANAPTKNLMIMRSYQMHAVEAITAKVAGRDWNGYDQRGGYVWHTTGSGKTLTSYKTATHLNDIGRADQVLLVVDRVDLNTQTLDEYRGFSCELVDVDGARSGGSLLRRLKDPDDRTLIVTTVNKLASAAKMADADAVDAIARKRIVVIVDECHRTTFGEMMTASKSLLPHAVFFGFTGTPIGSFNARGDLTTRDIFGECIAKYTIANGIHDGNVLEFDVKGFSPFEEEGLRQAVALSKAHAATPDEAFADPDRKRTYLRYLEEVEMCYPLDEVTGRPVKRGIEDLVPSSQYDTDAYRREVVANIRSCWANVSVGGKLHAMLATSSIPEAVEYYRLLREMCPDLRVTALFDPSDDYGGEVSDTRTIDKIRGIAEILSDYNAWYGKRYDVSSYAEFKGDLMDRLAHKGAYRRIDGKPEARLDICIVVDQLLTGYDSHWVRTLFLDKYLTHERIIQAFSRTNRLLDDDKAFGMIRYYRKPNSMRRNIEYAIRKYSGGEEVDVIVKPVTAHVREANEALAEIRAVFAAEGIDDMSRLPESDEAVAKFVKEVNRLMGAVRAATAQGFALADGHAVRLDEGTGEVLDETMSDVDEGTLRTLLARYGEVETKRGNPAGEVPPFEVSASISQIAAEKIDADYIDKMFHDYIAAVGAGAPSEEQQAALNALHNEFPKLSREDQLIADQLITEIQSGTFEVREGWRFSDYVNREKTRRDDACLAEICGALGCDAAIARELRSSGVAEERIDDFGRYSALRATVDRHVARGALEAIAGVRVRGKDVMRVADALLRAYILEGAFDVRERVADILSA